MFGFPALVLDRDVPVKWVDIDPNWTWDAVVRRWRAGQRDAGLVVESGGRGLTDASAR